MRPGAAIAILAGWLTCGTALAGPEIGASYEYVNSNGGRLRMTLLEQQPDKHVWLLESVTAEGVEPAAHIIQDGELRILRYEFPDDTAVVFEPHNCEHEVGFCTYTMTNPDGSVSAEQRINGIEDGIWNYSLWKGGAFDGAPSGIGQICYDDDGVTFWESWVDLESTNSWFLERVDNTCPIPEAE